MYSCILSCKNQNTRHNAIYQNKTKRLQAYLDTGQRSTSLAITPDKYMSMDARQILQFDFLQKYTISCKLRYFTVILASHKIFSVLLAKWSHNKVYLLMFRMAYDFLYTWHKSSKYRDVNTFGFV